jgi:tRNA dimethylallyltransferase
LPKKIILIAGPTASGKSKIAIEIAKKIRGEIINADSMQVYKEIKILTARPNKKNQKNIMHHLYGVVNLNKKFSTGQWLKAAIKKIKEIQKKKKTPILVGGTGLYFQTLIDEPDISMKLITGAIDKKKPIKSKPNVIKTHKMPVPVPRMPYPCLYPFRRRLN